MQNFTNGLFKRNGGAKYGLDTSFIIGLVVAVIFVAMFSWTPLVFPFRIFTTTLHEMSHAVVAILTGGTVSQLQLNANGSGVVFYYGGLGLLIAAAGYIGSTVLGGVMLLMAKSDKGRRNSLFLIGGLMIAVPLIVGLISALRGGPFLIVRDIETILLLALVTGLIFLTAWKGPDLLVTFVMYTLAFLSSLFAVFDLLNMFTSSISPFGGVNDARILESQTGVPAFIWAILWSAVSIFILWQFLRVAIRRNTGGNVSGDDTAGSLKSPLDKYNDKFNF